MSQTLGMLTISFPCKCGCTLTLDVDAMRDTVAGRCPRCGVVHDIDVTAGLVAIDGEPIETVVA